MGRLTITQTRPSSRDGWGEVALLVVPALLLGGLVRLVPMLAADFPLNDGGLFLVMMDDIQAAGFGLPATTTYNGEAIPFAYPPLALFFGAALSSFGVDPLAVMRWIPLVASLATIPLVYLVAKELLGSWHLAAAAALAFALIPRSYEWLITGGGLTRSIGMVLALLAIWQGVRLLRQPSAMHVVLVGLLGGLALLTHPEAALFVLVTLALFAMTIGRSLRGFASLVAAGGIAIAVAAPWWFAIIGDHGFGILVGAAGSRTAQLAQSTRQLIFGEFTGAGELDIFLGVGFIGLLIQLVRRRYLLPLWLLAITAVIAAAGFTFVTVPWAMVIAIAIMEVLLPAAVQLANVPARGRMIAVAGLLGAAVLSSLATGYGQTTPLHGLSAPQRTAMAWVDANLPEDAHFVIMTGAPWQIDATSEWFPALARRTSVATVQGYEWFTDFGDRAVRHQLLQELCAYRLGRCVEAWAEEFGIGVDYVYVPVGRLAGLRSPDDCCPALRADLRNRFEVVYDGDGATIFRIPRTPRPSVTQ